MLSVKAKIGVAILVLSVGLLAAMLWAQTDVDNMLVRLAGIAAAAAALISGLGLAWLGHRWETRLDQLRGWVNLVAGEIEVTSHNIAPGVDSIDRVQLAIIDMLGIRMDQQGAIYRRMEEVLDALPDGIAAVTPEGLVSLVNAAGRPLFGTDSIVGRSLFETITPASLKDAINRAQSAGEPLAAVLQTAWGDRLEATVVPIGTDGSALLRYPAAMAASVGLQHDLSLHDRPPPPVKVMPDTRLCDLPLLALDTETTGIDVRRDRVVSIGAVHLQGGRLLRRGTLNLLVNPERSIPSRSIAVHGISNSMVAGAPPFASVADRVASHTAGMVLIGHQIGFDLMMLQSEMRRCGRDWSATGALDVMLLYAGLFPDRRELSLDAVAAQLGTPVIGRHSALGDALTAGEMFLRLLTLLSDQGITTYGAADALQRHASNRLAPARRHSVGVL